MEDTRIAAIDEERIGELKVAEYLIFLFALDTYMRYLEEIRSLKVNTDVDPDDAVLKQGLSLLRMADREHLEIVKNEISASVTVPASLSMLEIAVSLPPTPKGAALRALKLRTVLSRGGTATSKAIFGKSTKARTEIREALDAAMLEDADAALAKLAMIDIRNTRLERWIDLASETAQPLPVADINPVTAATKVVTDSTQTLLEVGLARDGSTAASEESAIHTKTQADTLRQIEDDAQRAAAKGITKSGGSDAPVTRSEAIAIATTVAAAQKADTTDIRNIPPEFINGGYPLDPEQMAAALTDGRVLVAAGAGAGKCIRGDTLVRTASGMVPIEELAAGLLPDQSADRQETILGLGGPENTSTVLNNGHRMTRILTTRLGYRLEGTLVHPLLVLRDMQLQWVTLGELTLDDVICIDRRPGMFAEAPYRVPPRVFRKVTNARPTQLPEELTPKVASLLGYTVSEGQVVYGQHSTVNLSTTDPLQRDLYEAALDGLVDAWATAPTKTGWRTSFHGRANLEALADFGMTFTKAEEKEIPSGVLRSPRPVVVSFLRALFDGDGGFCRHEVYYDSASEKLARQVQELLLSFGIVSRLRFKPNSKKGCWNVSLTGDDARLYLREIGFNLVAKQQAAEEALMDKESNPNLDVIPGVAGLFRAVLSHARSQGVHVSKHAKHDVFKGYANGSRCPSYRMLHEFLDAYPGDTDAHQTLRTLADAQWFFDTIDSLKESEADVYDFVVPGTHAFSAGGFVNHNSTTLVSRIAYLVKSKGVKPARIFACSFNTKAANELGTKVAGKVGEAARDQMSIGTMNALFARFIRGDVRRGIPAFGSAEERDLFTDARLIADPEPPKTTKVGPKPINMTKAIQGIFKQCASALPAYTGWPKEWFDDIPKAKKCNLFVSVWKGNDVDYKQARANARSKAEKIASLWYEFYLGLKGDLPGWHPPCRVCKSFDNWMKDYRPGGERLGDLDDQIRILRDILRRDPIARKKIQSMFDHILVDEAQDRNLLNSEVFDLMSEHITDGADGKSLWIVGDDKQCVHVDTPITMASGADVRAGDLTTGDKVLAFRNGTNAPQTVRHVVKSSWTWGYRVTTVGGSQLTMSPNHKIWATDAVIPDECVITYLMFRKDFGFRVGITNRHDDERRYGTRPTHEHADRLWVLGLHENREEALLEEESLSLEYGIPTQVFEGEHRGLNQARIKDLFSRFGANGAKLLEARNLSFQYPHWFACGTTRGETERRLIYVNAHTARGTNVRLEWSGADLDAKLAAADVTVCTGKQADFRRIRKQLPNYREALRFAQQLSELTGAPIRERLSLDGENLSLLPAAGLLVGMSLPVLAGNDVVLDPIVKIEKVDGEFVDLDVDDASNFFGGGILSHNSIYQFRGARPEIFSGLHDKEGWTTRMIRTNYRCAPEIVEAANRLSANNTNQIPMEAQANPDKPRGRSSIVVDVPEDHATGAARTISRIMKETTEPPLGQGHNRDEYAVLSRTNRELDDFETACCIAEMPYARTGGRGLFDSPESKTVLGYIDLAYGVNFEKTAKSLADALMKPDRGLFLSAAKIAQIVEETLGDVARMEGRSVKDINPLDLVMKERYARELAIALKTPYRAKIPAFVFDKTVNQLTRSLLDMGSQVSKIRNTLAEGKQAADVIETILDGVSATVTMWDKDLRREVSTTKTLRQQITEDLAVFGDDDEEEAEETVSAPEVTPEGDLVPAVKAENPAKGLGAVQFLYLLNEQNNTDIQEGTDPTTAAGFLKKLTRIRNNSDKLRVDLGKWAKTQASLPPEQRQKRPDCIILSTVHCSPPDEPVLTTEGYVPISVLDPDKHRVASYMKLGNQLLWGKNGDARTQKGYGIKVSARPYSGSLVTLTTAASTTRVTPNHSVLVRFAPEFMDKYVVYLMRRGDWWRIGMCVSARRPYRGCGVNGRLATEQADDGWILAVCATRAEAFATEMKLQCQYGIPGLTFEAAKGRQHSSEELHAIHDSVKEVVEPHARKLLEDYGLSESAPLYSRSADGACLRENFVTEARNVLSGYMLVPVVTEAFVQHSGKAPDRRKPQLLPVTCSREPYDGLVYSLEVEKWHYYVSGGAVVHNSVKGAEWRDVTVVMAPGKFPIELKPSKDEAPPTPEESEAHLQAERNLGYVALTRAAESLTVLCPPQGKNVGLSRFVVEAGLTVGQNVEIPEGTEEISKTASTWVDHGLDVEYISNLADTAASYSR